MAYNAKKTDKNHSFGEALTHALAGLKQGIWQERNLKIQLLVAALAIGAAGLLGFSLIEWAILLLVIFLVIILELLNTVTETLVDLITDQTFHPLAKKAKDMAAGVVLVASILAVIIGLLLFVPKLFI